MFNAYDIAYLARMEAERDSRPKRRAEKAMKECEAKRSNQHKSYKHTYDVYENCVPCTRYMSVLNKDVEEERRYGCRQDNPVGINLEAVALHVLRAKTRESWVEQGFQGCNDTPMGLVAELNNSRVEWLLAIMYLLGWKRPEWAKDYEWM